MRPLSAIVPKKEGTDRWLYETLRHLQQGVEQSQSGLQAIVRGEVPDGSGDPLPSPDLTGYFKLIGRPGAAAQVGYGSTDAGGPLTFGSTSNAAKGFIYLGTSHTFVALDEVQSLVGINKGVPASTLHIVGSLSGTGAAIIPVADVAIGTGWVARGGPAWGGIAGSVAAAMTTDDGETSMGVINTASSGTNPQQCTLSGTIVPGATYTITFRVASFSSIPLSAILGCTLVDSAGNGWSSDPTNTGESYDSANSPVTITAISPTFYTVTRTVRCSGAPGPVITGSTPNSIRLFGQETITGPAAWYFGVTSLSIAQSGSSLVRWDLSSGTQSGGIDIFGRMGINTGSTLLAAELTVVGDNAVNPVLSLSTPVGQSADIVRIKDSTGAVTAAVTSRAAWAGHTDLVMYEDDVIGYADDTVYFY